jgi:hypothetical protein
VHRRRRLAVGMALVAVAAGASWLGVAGATDPTTSGVAAAGVPPVPLALAAVDASGSARTSEPGWSVARVDIGRYELTFPGEMEIALGTWNAIAEVTTKPVSETTWVVAFEVVGGDEPIDSSFTFLASPAG